MGRTGTLSAGLSIYTTEPWKYEVSFASLVCQSWYGWISLISASMDGKKFHEKISSNI